MAKSLIYSISSAGAVVLALGVSVCVTSCAGGESPRSSLLGTPGPEVASITQVPSATPPRPTVKGDGVPTQSPDSTPVASISSMEKNEPVPMTSPDYGVQAFLYWHDEVADRDLQLIRDAGFRWVKQEFAWREIEGAGPGIYDWTNSDRLMDQVDAHGLNIIARVGVQPEWAGGNYPEVGPPNDVQDFVNFLTALVQRYRGRIDAYQVWNEPNLAREWGERPPDPAEYTRMLQLAYQTIKANDPYAYVISAGLAPTSRWDDVAMPDTVFLQGMYDAGAAPYFDLLGAHGAGYKVPPETSPDEVADNPDLNNGDPSPRELRRIYCFRHVEDMRQVMVENGDEDKRVAVLEFGWTTDPRPDSPYAWHAVSDQQQAEYLVGAYQYAKQHWQPWIAVMSLIYMPDSTWRREDEQTYWSIIYPFYPDTWHRPAYIALKDMPKE